MRISDWSSDVCSSDLAALRTTRWFADKAAIVQLPSLQSLQLLRAVASRDGPGAGNGMIGFGDPLLEGNAATRGVEGRVRAARGGGTPLASSMWRASSGETPLAEIGRASCRDRGCQYV